MPAADSANKAENCNTWSPWVSGSHPFNNTEIERIKKSDIEAFCPSSKGGRISEIKCKDDKGEPFSERGFTENGDHSFKFMCGNLSLGDKGAECRPITTNGTCPDYAVKFHCICDPITSMCFKYSFSSCQKFYSSNKKTVRHKDYLFTTAPKHSTILTDSIDTHRLYNVSSKQTQSINSEKGFGAFGNR